MTKMELIKMIENLNDNEEIQFIYEDFDRDGFPYDVSTKKIYKVVSANAKPVKKEYGIVRYEEV